MSRSLFDPHRKNRQYSRRVQHRGQILQSRLMNPPSGIDLALAPMYLNFFRNNPQFGYSPPTPPPPRPVPTPIKVALSGVSVIQYSGGTRVSSADYDLSVLTPSSLPPHSTESYNFNIDLPSSSASVLIFFIKTDYGTYISQFAYRNPTTAGRNVWFVFPFYNITPISCYRAIYNISLSSSALIDTSILNFIPGDQYLLAMPTHVRTLSTENQYNVYQWYYADKDIFTFPWT